MKEEGLNMAREHRETNSDFYRKMGRAEHADEASGDSPD